MTDFSGDEERVRDTERDFVQTEQVDVDERAAEVRVLGC